MSTPYFEYPAGSGIYLTFPSNLPTITGGYRIHLAPNKYLDIPSGFDIETNKGFVRPENLIADDAAVKVIGNEISSSFTPLEKDAVSLLTSSVELFKVLDVEETPETRLHLTLSEGSPETVAQTEPLSCACVLLKDQSCGLNYILPFSVVEE